MADFVHIEDIQTLVSECDTHRKTLVQLQVTESADPLVLSCSNIEHMYSLANLIDGYCQLAGKTNVSLWNKKGKPKQTTLNILLIGFPYYMIFFLSF